MYTVADYGWMIADEYRMQAFAGALRGLVTSETVVVDIGTGTGIFALLAARFGARRVYAIEPESVIGLARQTAADNRLSDRIEFIQANARRADIPEPADVIVSDIGGVLPWHGNNLVTVAHAMRRWLGPGGHMLPQRDRISAAIVEAPSVYDELFGVWHRPLEGIDLSPARRHAVNAMLGKRFSKDQLLSDALLVHTLDYATNDRSDLDRTILLTARRAGTGHGIAVWMDRTVADGFEIANGPGSKADEEHRQTIYGHAFFPWPRPVDLSPGATVHLRLRASFEDDGYTWSWDTDISPGTKDEHAKITFRQTTAGEPPEGCNDPANVALGLSEDGDATRAGLGWMSNGLTLGDIAARLADRYPRRFPSPKDALSFAAELTRKFG